MGDRGTPRLTADQVISILRRHGFTLAGCAGSHQKWRNILTAKQVIVPYHRGQILPLGTMRAIIEGSGISGELNQVVRSHAASAAHGTQALRLHLEIMLSAPAVR